MNWPAWLTPNPLTRKRWQRFRALKRGYWSAILLSLLLLCAGFAELLVNNRALLVSYEGQWYFPTYGDMLPGHTFGLDYDYETHYRELAAQFAAEASGNWVLMPPVPYGVYENDLRDGEYPPYPPSWDSGHWLGTDVTGRDVLARLLYGFRTAMAFSLLLLASSYAIGIAVGCAMGYFGGAWDLIGQRLIEIWSNLPFLYVIMIVASLVPPNFWALLAIMVFFGWTSMTWYMRTATYKENTREYVVAARALGASSTRIIFRHILPNTVSTIVTFIPFSVASGITALTALDYLGFGLPPPTPSWGELLKQGTDNLESLWIVLSVVGAMTLVLMLVTYIGEAIREAFDPRSFSRYE
ncbi:MAG: ABC transporter permease [Spongiibacteraceae bacterium]|jgi:microcin C transport system permease protein|nr:ABC transporter permease [Spongiibacteraceae bacterium]